MYDSSTIACPYIAKWEMIMDACNGYEYTDIQL